MTRSAGPAEQPHVLTPGRTLVFSTVGTLILLLLIVLVPLAGGGIKLSTALAARPWHELDTPDALVFWGTRVPRVLLACLVGGTLAIAGLAFQAVLRNPLAEPYILGVSTGASLGRSIAVMVPLSTGALTAIAPLACFVGAMLPLALLHALSTRSRRPHTASLLLAGVMLNVLFSAIILLLQYFTDFTRVRLLQVWWMGGLNVVGYRELMVLGPFVLGGLVAITLYSRTMNVLSLDPLTAEHLGVDVKRASMVLLWIGSFLTSCVVAVSGPIGFVGLVVPHTLRLIHGADNRLLAPLSFIYGAIFLVVCDFAGWRGLEYMQAWGMHVEQPTEIPVGIITALVGAPFFLVLLLRRSGKEA